MGIEYIGGARIIAENHKVVGDDQRRVRFPCEKRRHTSQRQPMRPLATNADGWRRESERPSMTRSRRSAMTAIGQFGGKASVDARQDVSVGH
jgi:hypothetical protein